MKKVLFVVLVALALAAPAMAQDNAPSGLSTEVACGAGACFVPSFSFLGQIIKWAGSGTSNGLTYEFADCCIGPDKYKGTLSRAGLAGSATTNQIVASSCTTAWSGGSAVRLGNNSSALASARASLKIIAAPGGFPAGAYARMSSGTWVYTAGSDSCGF